ncbi:D-alanyl-D-alanine carboxypeptidase family protein [Sediminibacillus albus]|uniref:D-alanyl-D-alanine carboxypeptidase n=1 Tax=Sediminibacillus albus TaxID=407036 RepID=A0A1G8YTX0_9BACI|nr:D-alanyl-D-alanine carboxypeptidase family protein [Sediminibacillus albus]SDK06187.1 D-alanyl-D-alanine carboxypeptidase [Sediminibacillus albus]
MKRLSFYFIAIIIIFSIETKADAAKLDNELFSESGILIDTVTGQVLYEQNADRPMYPASLTKVATAIYAIETADLDEIVTVSAKARNVEGTRVYLEEGEQVPLKRLIQGLLLNSGNDAGVAIAEHISGSSRQFARDLNNYLEKKVGMGDTNFTNAHGLFNQEHVTTAADLAKLTQYALQNSTFKEIFGTEQLDWNGDSWSTTLYHHHKMVREIPYEGITGGKTGYVDESGHTLITTAERENISLIAVTLKTETQNQAYQDAIALLDYGFENFKTSIIPSGKEYVSPDGSSYTVEEDLYFTETKSGAVLNVGNDGTLKIKQNDKLLNTAFSLDDEADNKQSSGDVQKASSSDKVDQQSSFSTIVVIFLIGLVLLFFRKLIKRAIT